MAKKKSKGLSSAHSALESSVSPILEVNFTDPLFSIAAHPTRPIIVSGLATGGLYCNTYDPEKLEESQEKERIRIIEEIKKKEGRHVKLSSVSSLNKKWWKIVDDHTNIEGNDGIVTNWKTKRHKGSCRSVIFDPLESSIGENIYSVGTDHVIKKANTETGKVIGKKTIKDFEDPSDISTKLSHSATHPFLLVGSENGDVLVYDSKNLSSQLKFNVRKSNDDAINHILPMPAVSAYHYLTLGSTTLSHIDIRKGIITQSDDQEDELLSMCYSADCLNDNKNDTVLVSHGEGIVTIWKNSKNNFADQLSRIKINPHASIDAIVSSMSNQDDDMAASVWCGDSEGYIYRVNHKQGKVVETRVHSTVRSKHGAIDEVGMLDIDYDYRLISAGMDSLRIWSGNILEKFDLLSDDEGSSSDSDADDLDSEDNFSSNDSISSGFSGSLSDSNELYDGKSDDASLSDNSSDDEKAPAPAIQKRISRREKLGIDKKVSPEPELTSISSEKHDAVEQDEEDEEDLDKHSSKKIKLSKKISSKQMKNMHKHEHGIRRFEGL